MGYGFNNLCPFEFLNRVTKRKIFASQCIFDVVTNNNNTKSPTSLNILRKYILHGQCSKSFILISLLF